jgi:hypothetical protein
MNSPEPNFAGAYSSFGGTTISCYRLLFKSIKGNNASFISTNPKQFYSESYWEKKYQ